MASPVEIALGTNAADPTKVGAGAAMPTTSLRDSVGAPISPDSYAQVLAYNGDGTLNTVSFTDGINTWTQTLSYTAGQVTGTSQWVRS